MANEEENVNGVIIMKIMWQCQSISICIGMAASIMA
jgi:hypothetical protein